MIQDAVAWHAFTADAHRAPGPADVRSEAVAALLARLARAVGRATAAADEELIHKALGRSTDVGALIELLRLAVPLLSAEQEIDPGLEGSLASLDIEDELVRRAGGL